MKFSKQLPILLLPQNRNNLCQQEKTWGVNKMRKLFIIIALVLCATLLLVACNGNGNGGTPGRGVGAGNAAMGRSFEVEGLEITLSPNIGFTRFRDAFADNDGAYVFYIPITVTNVGDTSNGLSIWGVNVFSPEGIGLMGDANQSHLERAFSETSIFEVGNVQPGVTKEGNIYVFYSQDGEYTVEFYNRYNETAVTLKFTLEFNFDVVPEIKTEFELGETIDVDGLEITITGIVSWGIIINTWSDHNGEYYFALNVTMRNASDESRGFPWGFDAFAPNGHSVPNIAWDIDNEDITRADDILPGATLTGLLHLLYVGDGDYTLQFSDWTMLDDLTMRVPVTLDPDALPVIQTEFSLGEMFVFDDLEITITDDIQWATIDDRWSDLNGRELMIFPVTVTNVGDSANSLSWGAVTLFGPAGIELDSLPFSIMEDSVLRTGDIRPEATLNSLIHVLYDGDGEYVLEFSAWGGLTISVIFDIVREDDVTEDDDE